MCGCGCVCVCADKRSIDPVNWFLNSKYMWLWLKKFFDKNRKPSIETPLERQDVCVGTLQLNGSPYLLRPTWRSTSGGDHSVKSHIFLQTDKPKVNRLSVWEGDYSLSRRHWRCLVKRMTGKFFRSLETVTRSSSDVFPVHVTEYVH